MLLPPTNNEVEHIYSHLHRLEARSVAVTSANPGEGCTSVVIALAQRHLLSGHSTLVVDFNLFRPTLVDLELQPKHDYRTPVLVSLRNETLAFQGITAPQCKEAVMSLRQSEFLGELIKQWQQDYSLIIFDTSPLLRNNANNISADVVAAACDQTLLVMMAGITTKAMLTESCNALKQAEATLGGCIINDWHNPSLRTEMLREADRLKNISPTWQQRIKKWLFNNKFISMGV
ncbi:MAG: CpsD/CapB family tyrosine-protein kinase [Shewanella sp.]|uniref:CpsD/CapB family tyrosine-protein kinase n=1 Tax=Shewanella sp. SNU WT4 TaxID=2590015 RepID=UPI0011277ECF|nr:CpsD/CapB family tyrosine-protein kinase [Shewanella sp. SNU WT4]QDF68132.1 CpsD/CapB family tyrosine-protein kinase [Shewanella sp. SNU WT4]